MSIRRLRGAQIDGWDLGVVVTALELLTHSMRAQGVLGGPAFEVRDRLREAYEADCAAQLAQVSPSLEPAESFPDDLIPVKEAAKIMDCSQSNVRQRFGRGSLPGVKIGGRLYLSRAVLLEVVGR